LTTGTTVNGSPPIRTRRTIRGMSEPATEMSISAARDQLADVVNWAVYGGTPTHLTRRGRRLAVIVSEAQLAADAADAVKAREEAVAEACRRIWLGIQDSDEKTQEAVRGIIDRLMEAMEDASDLAAIDAVRAEREVVTASPPSEDAAAGNGQ
jgi:prevent-host-death family protein